MIRISTFFMSTITDYRTEDAGPYVRLLALRVICQMGAIIHAFSHFIEGGNRITI